MATTEKATEQKIAIPQLSRMEQLELQNIVLKMNIQAEKQEKLKSYMSISENQMEIYEHEIGMWKNKFNRKLKKAGIDINQVTINPEDGAVVISNVREI